MNKKYLVGSALAAVVAAGVAWNINASQKWQAKDAEAEKSAVVKYSYALAEGYDVKLTRWSSGETQLMVGKIENGNFKGPYLYALDRQGSGLLDHYSFLNLNKNCKGDGDHHDFDRNMLETALGKSTLCASEVALLRFASTEKMSRIERELLEQQK